MRLRARVHPSTKRARTRIRSPGQKYLEKLKSVERVQPAER